MEASILLTGIGLSVAAGLNAYIPMLIAGLLIRFGAFTFGEPYDLMATTPALVIVTLMLVLEVTSHRIPVVDHVEGMIQMLIRPISGAVLFAGTVTGTDAASSESLALVAGLLLAAGVHATKATARPAVNVATGGLGGSFVSTVEDGFCAGLSFAAILAPFLVVVILAGVALWFITATRRWAARRGRGPRPG